MRAESAPGAARARGRLGTAPPPMIPLSDEEKRILRERVAGFLREELELEAGVIASGKTLDFFLESLGPLIYNKALDDARAWHGRAIENAGADFATLYRT